MIKTDKVKEVQAQLDNREYNQPLRTYGSSNARLNER